MRCLLTDGYYGFKMDLFAAGLRVFRERSGGVTEEVTYQFWNGDVFRIQNGVFFSKWGIPGSPKPYVSILIWLVVWNMNFIFPFSWECHHPNWLIFFRGVGLNHQPGMVQFRGEMLSKCRALERFPSVVGWSCPDSAEWFFPGILVGGLEHEFYFPQ